MCGTQRIALDPVSLGLCPGGHHIIECHTVCVCVSARAHIAYIVT